MRPSVVRHPSAGAFLERAEAWLVRREAENNLLLALAATLASGDHDYEEPVYLATVEDGGEVVGCAWRTPPFKLGVTRMPPPAVPALVSEVAAVYDELGAVLGDEEVAGAFARAWAALQGVDVRPGMRQRIYELTAVDPPRDPPAGRMRRAGADDLGLALDWWRDFEREAHVTMGREAETSVRRRIAAGDLWLWEDGRPVCLAGVGGRSPGGVRIGPVYTPPEDRRRGYATALVAELSALHLRAGRSFCFLYTDLSNPTSNSVYTRIGYRPVADVQDFHFEDRGGRPPAAAEGREAGIHGPDVVA